MCDSNKDVVDTFKGKVCIDCLNKNGLWHAIVGLRTKDIIEIFKKVKTNIDSGTATFIQDAAIAALSDEKHVEEFRFNYEKKKNTSHG